MKTVSDKAVVDAASRFFNADEGNALRSLAKHFFAVFCCVLCNNAVRDKGYWSMPERDLPRPFILSALSLLGHFRDLPN